MIEAVIFDMDGILIDSEPLWKIAEQNNFAKVGIELNDELCKQTTGLDGMGTIMHWYTYKPWEGMPFEELKANIENSVIDLVKQHGKASKGVSFILDYFVSKKIRRAVASSSPLHIIETVLERLKITQYFELLQSSETEIAGKPHPAVYQAAARRLNLNPSNCLAFEDSINGMIAAKKAGMKVVVVPDQHLCGDHRYNDANLIIDSLDQFNEDHFKYLNSLN